MQILEDVLQPWCLVVSNCCCCLSIFYLPFIDELVWISNFSCNWWNTCCCQSPVILVTANCDAHHLLCRAFLCSCLKRRFLGYLGEYALYTRPSFLNIIFISSIERINEWVSIWVHVDHKWQLVGLALHEVFICDRFRLWKWFAAWIIVAAGIEHCQFLR